MNTRTKQFRIYQVSISWGRTALAAAFLVALLGVAQPEIFSGPQPGEKTTPFKSVELRGDDAGQERDIIAEHKETPTHLICIHGIERSMASLITVLDAYGQEPKDQWQ